jgi:1-deoxy-D-xylulose-5-phosphate reductoisomerase
MKKIAVLGCTGSIGKNVAEVVAQHRDKFKVELLVAQNNVAEIARQIDDLQPKTAIIENEKKLTELKNLVKFKGCEILASRSEIENAMTQKFDLVVSAIMGFAGLVPTFNAIKAGSDIAIANKESLVCAGEILMNEAAKSKAKIIPIDSEHNAIFQVFEKQNLDKIEKIILTASGGPFFKSEKKFSEITVEEALKHPNWKMGAKISIDSATMMNKGLEMIEAFHLFPIKKGQIEVLVHPQSIIHGFVNYQDGSTLAMLSLPDMKIPIAHALSYPNRMEIKRKNLDLAKIGSLDFFAPDEKKFRALKLCRQAMEKDGNAPILLNAANEVAVAKFLKGEIKFSEITQIVETVLNKIPHKNIKTLDEVLEFDLIGRREI